MADIGQIDNYSFGRSGNSNILTNEIVYEPITNVSLNSYDYNVPPTNYITIPLSTYDNLNACVICENNCMKAENRKKEEEKKLEKEQQQKMELENLDIEIDAIKKDCVKITEAKHSAIKAFNEQYNKIINK